jgi:heme-NO-binding protein
LHGLILSSFVSFLQETYVGVDRVVATGAAFVESEAYPDEEFTRLVEDAAAELDTSPQDLQRAFGRFAGRHTFARLYPEFYVANGGTRTFLLEVEQKIHDLVRATIPRAAPPRLHIAPFGEDGTVVTYTSERRLCAMAEGLIEGVADYYGESAEIDHSPCMLRGDLACALFVVLASERSQT